MGLVRNTMAATLAMLLVACATPREQAGAPLAAPQPAASSAPTPAHDNLNATLWMQNSVEYAATSVQAFRQACDALAQALADPRWNALPLDEQRQVQGFESLRPAVIADLDETLVDNSPYQARQVLAGGGFDSASWTAWVGEARARAVPGALEYARCAEQHGVALVYLSNRKHEGEREPTIANLRALGFPFGPAGEELVLLRGDPRAPGHEKGTRRKWVAERYRVVQLLGDNLGDFLDGIEATPAERQALTEPYMDWWGRRWFMLPNPSYGSWESALLKGCATPEDPAACKRAALRTR